MQLGDLFSQKCNLRFVRGDDDDPTLATGKKALNIRVLVQQILDNSHLIMVSVTKVVKFFTPSAIGVDKQERRLHKGCTHANIVTRVDLIVVKGNIRESEDVWVPGKCSVFLVRNEISLVSQTTWQTYMRYCVSNTWTFRRYWE